MKKYIIPAVLALAAAALVFYGSNKFNKSKFQQEIDGLNAEIKLQEDTIQMKEKEIEVFAEKVEIAEQKLEENKGKVKVIYKEYEVQVQTVDSYDINQLEQFFANRYADTTASK